MRHFFKLFVLFVAIQFGFRTQLFAQDFENSSPQRQQIHTEDISKLSPLEILEDSLVYFADSMYNSPIPENRADGNEYFIRLMKRFLRTEGSYQRANKKLSQKINIISPPDNSFKIYNWEVIQATELGRYYGVIQMQDGQIKPLIDISDKIIRGAEDSTFSNGRWFGCIYYNIIQRDIAGQQIYFLLGWNGNSLNSERKIIEAFGFDSRGQIQFGAPLFVAIERGKRKNVNRFVLEYQRGSKVSLNLDKETNQIILDH